jgi:hypothetical protein
MSVPFEFATAAELVEITGMQTRNVAQLHALLRANEPVAIFHHTYRRCASTTSCSSDGKSGNDSGPPDENECGSSFSSPAICVGGSCCCTPSSTYGSG